MNLDLGTIVGIVATLSLVAVYLFRPSAFFILIQYCGYALFGIFSGLLLSFAVDNLANAATEPVDVVQGHVVYAGPYWATVWKSLPMPVSGTIFLFAGCLLSICIARYRLRPQK
jgi:hypothetical protein